MKYKKAEFPTWTLSFLFPDTQDALAKNSKSQKTVRLRCFEI